MRKRHRGRIGVLCGQTTGARRNGETFLALRDEQRLTSTAPLSSGAWLNSHVPPSGHSLIRRQGFVAATKGPADRDPAPGRVARRVVLRGRGIRAVSDVAAHSSLHHRICRAQVACSRWPAPSAAQVGAAELVGAPDDERGSWRGARARPGRAPPFRRRPAGTARRRGRRGTRSSKAIPQSSIRLVKRPTERREACSVRAATAVPTWQATMPAKVIVVACRYAWWSGEPASTSSPGLQPACRST